MELKWTSKLPGLLRADAEAALTPGSETVNVLTHPKMLPMQRGKARVPPQIPSTSVHHAPSTRHTPGIVSVANTV